jgi:murein L,D-transpeptidase YafK
MRRGVRFSILSITTLLSLIAAVLCTAAAASTPQADRILIIKSSRTMELLNSGKVMKTYKVALGTVPVGPKHVEGDHKTPEGSYVIDAKNPQSQFHLSLHISYPSAVDRQRAIGLGTRPGGAIMIHAWQNRSLTWARYTDRPTGQMDVLQ